jgi:hypothetical protein
MQVTKYCGGVAKGFTTVAGIVLTAFVRTMLDPNASVSPNLIVAGVLVTASIYMQTSKSKEPKVKTA